jgi:hypothetical protein
LDLIQQSIKDCRLKFDEKKTPMKADSNSLSVEANYAEPIGFEINMFAMTRADVTNDLDYVVDQFYRYQREVFH